MSCTGSSSTISTASRGVKASAIQDLRTTNAASTQLALIVCHSIAPGSGCCRPIRAGSIWVTLPCRSRYARVVSSLAFPPVRSEPTYYRASVRPGPLALLGEILGHLLVVLNDRQRLL